MGSSRTRAWTHVLCIGRRILNHCATREAHPILFYLPLDVSQGRAGVQMICVTVLLYFLHTFLANLTTGLLLSCTTHSFRSGVYQRSRSVHTPPIPGMLAAVPAHQNQAQSTGPAPSAPLHSLAMASALPALLILFPKLLPFISLFSPSHSLGRLLSSHGA